MKRPKPNEFPTLVDGDIIVYRIAHSVKEGTEEEAVNKTDDFITGLTEVIGGYYPQYELFTYYLTGSGNFRYDVAKTHPYKGNRSDVERPKNLDFIREYMIDNYSAVVSLGCEADDMIATQAYNLGYNCIIASTDKDFMQIPCWIYNWGRREWYRPSEYEAALSLYTQVLTGDRVDNIVGLYNIGPKKAEKILKGCTTEEEMFNRCVEAYDGDADRVIENLRLLYLQKHEGELWSIPWEVQDK